MSVVRQWVIDVCRYCGRHAVWPGCEHWQSSITWTVPVVVKGRWTPARRAQQPMSEESGER